MMHSLIKSYIQIIKYSSAPDALQVLYSLVDKEELLSDGTPANWIIK